MPESAFTVMAMPSAAAAASAELDPLYSDLRAARLLPLRRNLLTDQLMPRARSGALQCLRPGDLEIGVR
jgi:hypothetical protein